MNRVNITATMTVQKNELDADNVGFWYTMLIGAICISGT